MVQVKNSVVGILQVSNYARSFKMALSPAFLLLLLFFRLYATIALSTFQLKSEERPPQERQQLPQALAEAADRRRRKEEFARERLAQDVDAPRFLAVDVDLDAHDGLVDGSRVDFKGRELSVAVRQVCESGVKSVESGGQHSKTRLATYTSGGDPRQLRRGGASGRACESTSRTC